MKNGICMASTYLVSRFFWMGLRILLMLCLFMKLEVSLIYLKVAGGKKVFPLVGSPTGPLSTRPPFRIDARPCCSGRT